MVYQRYVFNTLYTRTDRRMDKLMARLADTQTVDGWKNGRIGRTGAGFTSGRTDKTNRQTDGASNEHADGHENELTDKQIDGLTKW